MRHRSIVVFAVFLGAVTGCQAGLDVDRYCVCSKVADEARTSMLNLRKTIQDAESMAELVKIGIEYDQEIEQKDAELRACLLKFQKIESEVNKLWEVEIVYKTNANELLFLLKSSEESLISRAYIRKRSRVLAEEFEEVVRRTRSDREKLCTE